MSYRFLPWSVKSQNLESNSLRIPIQIDSWKMIYLAKVQVFIKPIKEVIRKSCFSPVFDFERIKDCDTIYYSTFNNTTNLKTKTFTGKDSTLHININTLYFNGFLYVRRLRKRYLISIHKFTKHFVCAIILFWYN